jgi:hypothetical protein
VLSRKPKLMRFLRWSLLLIVAFLGYVLAVYLSAREFTWWIVPALMLVTATTVIVAKKVGTSPRVSIVLAGVGILVVCPHMFRRDGGGWETRPIRRRGLHDRTRRRSRHQYGERARAEQGRTCLALVFVPARGRVCLMALGQGS